MSARGAFCALVAGASLVLSLPAFAHAVVKQSAPANGAVLDAAPAQVDITFNEKVEKLFSTVILKNGAGKAVPTAKASVDPANPAVLHLPLPPLASGKYVAHWTAVGHDGHRLSGDIRFSIK
jgi:methionine-rich copper-binding protein CopC